MTPCLTCGTPCRGPRCRPHQREYKAALYGPDHRAEKAAWVERIALGEVVVCWRCDLAGRSPARIMPGEPFDLGHREGLPRHPEHPRCNREAH